MAIDCWTVENDLQSHFFSQRFENGWAPFCQPASHRWCLPPSAPMNLRYHSSEISVFRVLVNKLSLANDCFPRTTRYILNITISNTHFWNTFLLVQLVLYLRGKIVVELKFCFGEFTAKNSLFFSNGINVPGFQKIIKAKTSWNFKVNLYTQLWEIYDHFLAYMI